MTVMVKCDGQKLVCWNTAALDMVVDFCWPLMGTLYTVTLKLFDVIATDKSWNYYHSYHSEVMPGRVPGRGRGHQAAPESQEMRSRKWWQYSIEKFEAAVAEIRAGASLRRTAAKYGIPRSTLQNYKSKEQLCVPHPSRAITVQEEEALVRFTLWMANRGFPVTRRLLMRYAFGIVKKSGWETQVNLSKGLSKMWWSQFKTRHPEIALRQAEAMDR